MPPRLDALPRITSLENTLVKRIARLNTSSRERRAAGLMVLDGAHLVSAFARTAVPMDVLAVSESALDNDEVLGLLDACAARERVVLSKRVFDKLSTVVTPVGILGVVPIPVAPSDFVGNCDVVVLDRVQDAGNVGAILRTSAAAGIGRVILTRGSADPWSPRVLRAAMGAHFALRLQEMLDLRAALQSLSIRTVTTAGQGGSNLFDTDLTDATAWLFGNEGRGLPPEALAAADVTVGIPMDPAVESMNVAAAVAVCLFEQVRQRRARRL